MKTDRRLRVGIVGLGYIGSAADEHPSGDPGLTHASAYQARPSCELVSGADPDAERRVAFSQTRGATAYADYAEMLAGERLDVLSVCTPSALRLPVIRTAMSHGVRAIFCEKPLALTLEDATTIERETAAAGIPLVLAYLRRWDPAVREARALLERAALGTLQHVVGRYTKGIVHNGTHLIDLLATLGVRVASVEALGEPRDDRTGDERTLDARLTARAAHGSIPAYFLAGDYRQYSMFELDLVSSAGRVSMTDGGRTWRITRTMTDPMYTDFTVLGEPSLALQGDSRAAMIAAVDETLSLARGEHPRATCTARDGVYALAVARAVLASADQRQLVTL